jgi:hypothetical protein
MANKDDNPTFKEAMAGPDADTVDLSLQWKQKY